MKVLNIDKIILRFKNLVLLYLDLFYCNKINIFSIYLLSIKCKLFLMIIKMILKLEIF